MLHDYYSKIKQKINKNVQKELSMSILDRKKAKKQGASSPCSAGSYLVFFPVFVWESALPATLLDVLLQRESERIFDALLATVLLVCFAFAIDVLLSPVM